MNHNPVLESYLKNLIGELSAAKGDDGEVLHSYCELSNVGAGRWGRGVFRLAIHSGLVMRDRGTPHFHVYLNGDRCPENPRFNFEVSLDGILSGDDLQLTFQRDTKRGLVRTNGECSWDGYEALKKDLTAYLMEESVIPLFGKRVTHLSHVIFGWNNETDYLLTNHGINIFGRYCRERNIGVLPQYSEYINDYGVETED